jgi:hypothetical protein
LRKRAFDIALAADCWRPAAGNLAICDCNADACLPAQGERRLADRPCWDIDRSGSGVAGIGNDQERGK